MKTIEILVSPKGEVKIETKGFSGSACQDATRALERAMGSQAAPERLTAEYHQSAQQQVNQ